MKKIIAGILIISALALMLVGCGGGESKNTPSAYDLQKIMLEADTTLPDMTTVNSNSDSPDELFAYLSDISYDKVDGFFLAYSSEGKADEIAVIKLKKSSDVNEAVDSLKAHVQGRVNLYKNYDPEQTPRAEKALVFGNGSYAVLIISDGQSSVKAAFDEAVK